MEHAREHALAGHCMACYEYHLLGTGPTAGCVLARGSVLGGIHASQHKVHHRPQHPCWARGVQGPCDGGDAVSDFPGQPRSLLVIYEILAQQTA